jgi:hypothetical protein
VPQTNEITEIPSDFSNILKVRKYLVQAKIGHSSQTSVYFCSSETTKKLFSVKIATSGESTEQNRTERGNSTKGLKPTRD